MKKVKGRVVIFNRRAIQRFDSRPNLQSDLLLAKADYRIEKRGIFRPLLIAIGFGDFFSRSLKRSCVQYLTNSCPKKKVFGDINRILWKRIAAYWWPGDRIDIQTPSLSAMVTIFPSAAPFLRHF